MAGAIRASSDAGDGSGLDKGELALAPAAVQHRPLTARGLEGEQGTLAIQAAAITRQRSIGADHAVAGDDDRHRRAPNGSSDRTRLSGAQLSRERAVRRRLAIGDLEQRRPNTPL